VRTAANLAVDREGMVQLLGYMLPGTGLVPKSSPWYGQPKFNATYDPKAAAALMAEAGYSKAKPLEVKAIISPSGSSQMQPMAMNEAIQQFLAEVGIRVTFDVFEWNVLQSNWRAGAKDPSGRGAHSTNSTYFSQDPFACLIRHLDTSLFPPKGTNWGYYSDPEMDNLFATIRSPTDPAAQLVAIQRAHEKVVDDALFLFVAHNVNPHAKSTKVKGFIQAQNWFQDFTPVAVQG
jgi:peptide/nickel transport system substrate-binding protein